MGPGQRALAIVVIWVAVGGGWFALYAQLFLTRVPMGAVVVLTAILALTALGGTFLVLRAGNRG